MFHGPNFKFWHTFRIIQTQYKINYGFKILIKVMTKCHNIMADLLRALTSTLETPCTWLFKRVLPKATD